MPLDVDGHRQQAIPCSGSSSASVSRPCFPHDSTATFHYRLARLFYCFFPVFYGILVMQLSENRAKHRLIVIINEFCSFCILLFLLDYNFITFCRNYKNINFLAIYKLVISLCNLGEACGYFVRDIQ